MTGPLGKKVDAPSSFAPEILFSISRDEQRYKKQLINQDGVDIWNIHELFWVDKKGPFFINPKKLMDIPYIYTILID